jgi:hypothetical protein
LINVPFLLLTDLLSISPVNSFFLLNSFIALFTIAFICYAPGLDPLKRYCLVLFYISSGTTYYLHWSHPEVFCASLLLISLLLMARGAYVPASLLLALSAQQNPPIGLVAALSLLLGFYFNVIKARPGGRQAWNGLLLLVAAMLLVLSPLFYYINFGVPNLISKNDTDNHYFSVSRLGSFFFDLNDGMICSIPFFLLLAPVAYLWNCFNRHWRVVFSASALVIISVLLAIPCLSVVNWSSGCQVVSRHVYWASMPIGFAFALLVVGLPRMWKWIILIVAVAGQISLVIGHRIDGGLSDDLHYSNAAEWVLNHCAHYYNPPVQLLITEGMHSESYDCPVYYYVFENKVTKIAYRKDAEQTVMPWSLSIAAMKKLPGSSTLENEGGWAYLNPPDNIKTDRSNGLHSWGEQVNDYHGESLGFGVNDQGVRYLGEGWCIPEQWGDSSRGWGIWSQRVDSELFFAYDNIGDNPLLLKFSGKPFVIDKCPEQAIDVLVNGHYVSTVVYHSMETQTTSLPIPANFLNNSKIIDLHFVMKDASSPVDLGLSDNDSRQLGFFLMGLQLGPDPKYQFPQLDFGPTGNSAPYLETGWSTPDASGGTWSVGLESSLHMDLPHAPDRDMNLMIKAGAFTPSPRYPQQTAEIIVNDHSLGKLTYSSLTPKIDTLLLPASIFFKNGETRLNIVFKVKQAVSPQELGLGTDPRKLGLCLINLSLEPIKK